MRLLAVLLAAGGGGRRPLAQQQPQPQQQQTPPKPPAKPAARRPSLPLSSCRSAQLKRYNTTAEALDARARNESDAVFGDKAQLWLWSQKPDGKCCEIVGQDIKDAQTLGLGVAAGLRKEDGKLLDALNKAFGEMMTDGTYKRINEKYFSFPLN